MVCSWIVFEMIFAFVARQEASSHWVPSSPCCNRRFWIYFNHWNRSFTFKRSTFKRSTLFHLPTFQTNLRTFATTCGTSEPLRNASRSSSRIAHLGRFVPWLMFLARSCLSSINWRTLRCDVFKITATSRTDLLPGSCISSVTPSLPFRRPFLVSVIELAAMEVGVQFWSALRHRWQPIDQTSAFASCANAGSSHRKGPCVSLWPFDIQGKFPPWSAARLLAELLLMTLNHSPQSIPCLIPESLLHLAKIELRTVLKFASCFPSVFVSTERGWMIKLNRSISSLFNLKYIQKIYKIYTK